ncbi:hypothetical protein SAMN02744124_00599 [Paenibacillus barengoltzii J12]|uniref:Uncharacterized protein n=1 Tax=Paenibacillus barengoltzii J12 TaxID=935846 RepID=A0ABY1LVE0_9BACL|nr:hypothetical protein SAMN02744124_00599 [Paenibacillus barengoltzii J12]
MYMKNRVHWSEPPGMQRIMDEISSRIKLSLVVWRDVNEKSSTFEQKPGLVPYLWMKFRV